MFVYVISSSDQAVKIGYSADPERRLRQLQTGHERKLVLIYKEPVSPERAPILEKLIHAANRHKCVRGEWFALTHEQAINEVKWAVIRYEDQD